MKYIKHSFKCTPGEYIIYDEKCFYCNKSIRTLLEIYNRTLDIPRSVKDILNLMPCLSEDEYIIKQIIE